MSPVPNTASLQEKATLLFNSIDPQQSAPHVPFLANQLKSLHGKLESRLYSYFSPQNADLCTTLVYAVPASLIIKLLTSSQIATLSVLGSAYIWSCKEELISKQAKIDLMHSVAIGFFANMFNMVHDFSKDSLVRLPIDMALMIGSIVVANQIEKATEQTSFDAETVAEDPEAIRPT